MGEAREREAVRREGAADGQAQRRAPRRRSRRLSRLIRKLAVVFLLFAAVGVALNCALGYIAARDTYLQAQAQRLYQVGVYAAESARSNADLAQRYEDWTALKDAGLLDPTKTLAQAQADSDDAYAAYQQLYDEISEKYADSTATSLTAEDEARLNESYEAFEQADVASSYYSLAAMLGRLRTTFDVESVALLIPDDVSSTVTYVADGGDGSAPGPHEIGDVEAREGQSYDMLWQTASGQQADGPQGQGVAQVADGSLYVTYVPMTVGDGTTWVFEVSMGTEAFNEAVMRQMVGSVLFSCAVFAVCLVGILVILRQSLVHPVEGLSRQVRSYAATKDASVAAEIRAERLPHDEVGELASNVADMVDEIQRHVEQVGRMSAERERVRSELAVAHRIQLSALPRVTAPFTGESGAFSLFASMDPAKEVGGDFYDFFMVDETHCAVVVADVSGKGVPAALFMMRAKALLRQLLAEGLPPAEAMARANDGLAADNDENMFVTVWLGVLDTATGGLAFANGGHNPPVMLHADGTVEWLRARSGVLLGGFAGMPYRGHELLMRPGDTLVLYTDGVTEAMDVHDVCYGEERLESLLPGLAHERPEDLARDVKADVRAYAGRAEQADDITLLALRYGI